MDGFVASPKANGRTPSAASPSPVGLFGARPKPSLSVRRLAEFEAVVVTKTVPGFDRNTVETAVRVVRETARLTDVKFLVLDFAHEGEANDEPAEGFSELVSQIANLVLYAPIVTVAVARGPLRGADLELALACNMLTGEEAARFSFDADPLVSIRTYAFLAQKIGFVRAERLMENGQVLGAAEMRDLLLLKEVLETGSGLKGLDGFLRRNLRRHNSSYGIYRAQRIATPLVAETFQAAAHVA